jgi:hypothetical protein
MPRSGGAYTLNRHSADVHVRVPLFARNGEPRPPGPPANVSAVQRHRFEQVLIETNRHRIAGTMTLAPGGYRSRVSDVLNAGERDFISLTDVTVELIDHEGPGTEHAFMAISRHHIVFAILDPRYEDTGLDDGP